MFDNARKIVHCWCQSSNECLYLSRSNLEGDPFGLNAFGDIAVTWVTYSSSSKATGNSWDKPKISASDFLPLVLRFTMNNLLVDRRQHSMQQWM
jgi:hypothetical protein